MKSLIEQIDHVLPQTQCGLCGHGGCLPYAKAIAEGDSIDKCPPGGVPVLEKLAHITQQDPSPYYTKVQAMAKLPSLAYIREAECIGCMKCIKACPVDAIVGAPKLLHTVLINDCTGCELCIAPCPVDCIEMHPLPARSGAEQEALSEQWRERYQQHNLRLEKQAMQKAQEHEQAVKAAAPVDSREEVIAARKAFIAEAIARAKTKPR